MPKLTFKTDNCKGCGLCVDACPKGVLAIAKEKINKRGHHPVEAVKEDACIGCTFCATMCPDCIIKIEK
ncbi:MAG: 4Fe-4S binding protein [Clostridia bacterium]|nr:4Fe-4S binding protein [Clostridia bacterium]